MRCDVAREGFTNTAGRSIDHSQQSKLWALKVPGCTPMAQALIKHSGVGESTLCWIADWHGAQPWLEVINNEEIMTLQGAMRLVIDSTDEQQLSPKEQATKEVRMLKGLELDYPPNGISLPSQRFHVPRALPTSYYLLNTTSAETRLISHRKTRHNSTAVRQCPAL